MFIELSFYKKNRVVRLPTPVYELVNKQTKFTVVYIRLRPKFRLRVRLPVRLLKNVAIGLPEAHLPNTSVEVRLLKVYLPKVRLQVSLCNVCLPMGHLRWI